MTADLWAGAEVQLATTASYLVERSDVDLTAVLFNEGALARELRRLGVPVTIIDEQRSSAVTILISLTRWLRDHPVEVVHTHRYKDTVLGAVAARLAGVPGVIRTVHGRGEPLRGWPWVRYRLYEAFEKVTLRCFADRIVAVSRRLARSLEESGHKPGAVVAIHNGVELSRIRPTRDRKEVRRELGIDFATPLIGAVGRLSPVKGHAHFVRAARLIAEKEPAARFLIVGDGPLRSELESCARRLGIGDACLFVGARQDVYDLVAAMDVFVLPSVDEGIPMALLEAMALETPVVATAVGGVPEVVAHRATGLLVRSGDEPGLAEASLELIRDPRLARALGARARGVVEAAFSHEENGLQLMKAYRAITPDPKPGSGPRLLSQIAALVGRARRCGAAALRLSERRRGQRIRREPSALVAVLRRARRILVVCHGNIIRSPFAARLLAQAVGEERRVMISSAGLEATPGTSPPPAAILIAARFQVDVSDHVSARLTGEDVAASDVIFVMDVDQLRVMQRRFPQARGKAFLLASLAPTAPLEVSDPFDQEDSVFQSCFEHISTSIQPLVRLLETVEGQ
jgi:glycosyltransferase involved in cell wall biosynthesis/protein-tyrosine-phosphatase